MQAKDSNTDILMDLNGFIQHLLNELDESEQHLIQDNNPYLLKVCYTVEKILTFHLKDVNIIGQTTMWDFIQNLPKCLPGTQKVIDISKDSSKSSIGRGRAFIRHSLNSGSLGDYISALTFDVALVKNYYKDSSYIKDPEFLHLFTSLIESLGHVKFNLVVKDKDLDKQSYWEDVAIQLLTTPASTTSKKFTSLSSSSNAVSPSTSSTPNAASQSSTPLLNSSTNSTTNNVLISTPLIESNIESLMGTGTDDTDSTVVNEEPKKPVDYNSRKSLNLDELNLALNEIEEESELDDSMIVEYDILVDSLAKSKKAVLLEYGAKGYPLNASDQGIDSLCFAIEQILSHEIASTTTHLWDCIKKLCEGSQDILNIEALYPLNSSRMKSWLFKSLTEATLSECFRLNFSQQESTLKQLYKPQSIMLSKTYRNKVQSILGDLLSIIRFQLKWNQDIPITVPNQSQSGNPNVVVKKTIVTKIIKKKIKKPTSENPNEENIITTTTTTTIVEQPIDSNNNNNNISTTIIEQTDNNNNTNTNTNNINIIKEEEEEREEEQKQEVEPQLINNNIENNFEEQSNIPKTNSLIDLLSLQNELNQLDNDNLEYPSQTQQPQPQLQTFIENENNRERTSSLTEAMRASQLGNPNNNTSISSMSSMSIRNSQNNVQSSIHSSVEDEIESMDPHSDTSTSVCSSYSNSFTNIHEAISKSYQPNPNLNNFNNQAANRNSQFVSGSLDTTIFNDYFRDDMGSSSVTTVLTGSALKSSQKMDNPNKLEGEDGIFINVLHRKPKFNTMNNQLCPGCGAFLDKLGFFKTRFCYYTGKHFCNNCHHNEKTLIPARILFRWDFRPYTVSDLAKTYLSIYFTTTFDIFQFNPEVYNLSINLQRVLKMRRIFHYIYEYIETCRNNKEILSQCKINEYFIKDNVNLYTLQDLDQVSTGLLENIIENVMQKFIKHVSVVCDICKGKGFICEYCGDENNLLFSWMILEDNQRISKCEKCQSLHHKKCASKSVCPKCIRIDRVKSRSVSNNANANSNNLNSSTGFNPYNQFNDLHDDSKPMQQPVVNPRALEQANFNINYKNSSSNPKNNYNNINWI